MVYINGIRFSFTALHYAFSNPDVSIFFISPKIVIQALFLGPLKAQTIEQFAANDRSESFRTELRNLLLQVNFCLSLNLKREY